MHAPASHYAKLIKAKAIELGFDFCGVAKADFLEDEAPLLETWLKNGMHGQMNYMANHFDKRLDPRLLVDDAKSVVTMLLNYSPQQRLPEDDTDYKLSKYAYGQDYHFVIKDKLKDLMAYIHEEIGEVGGRAFVDSAPVMDKAWAKRAGLGWVGKHTNLINRAIGSFFFIGELILDLELEPDGPITDYCGTCTRCLDACPTNAILPNRTLDSSACISYATIEHRGRLELPLAHNAFGCDICQEVCPWNRRPPEPHPAFAPRDEYRNTPISDLLRFEQADFSTLFRKSAIKRAKLAGMQRNVAALTAEDDRAILGK